MGSIIPEKSGYWVGLSDLYPRLFAWLMRRIPSERQRLLAVTILAGGLCGLAAVAFHPVSYTHLDVYKRQDEQARTRPHSRH